MREARPLNSIPNIWPMEFEGKINGKRAVALVNDTEEIKTWKLADLGLPAHCYDLLHDRKVFHEITIDREDAALLIAE